MIAGEYVYVAVKAGTDSYEGIVTATESAALLLDALARDTDRDSLVKLITDSYDIDENTAARDVDAFLQLLDDKHILFH